MSQSSKHKIYSAKAAALAATLLCATLTAQELADPNVARSLQRLQDLNSHWTAEWEQPVTTKTDRGTSSAHAAARQMAQSEDPELRKRAIEVLAKDGRTPTLRELLWALGDPSPGVREIALTKLAPVSPAALLESALDILLENDEESVYALDRALPGLPASVGDEFARIFRDKDQPIPLRRAAAYALGKLRVPGIAAELADGTAETEATLATSCALALYALRDTQSVPRWVPLVQHPDLNVAWLAIRALGELGGREAFATLADIAFTVTPVDPQLVPVAINAIAAWPLVDSVPALIETMRRNSGYRRTAAALLRFRTGVALGDSSEEWQEWYVNGFVAVPEEAPLTEDAPTELLKIAEFVPPDLRGRGF